MNASAAPETPAVLPLTDNGGQSERCLNPFCKAEMKGRKGKKFCSDRCRLDGYVLRRAWQMIDGVGLLDFFSRMKGFNDTTA